MHANACIFIINPLYNSDKLFSYATLLQIALLPDAMLLVYKVIKISWLSVVACAWKLESLYMQTNMQLHALNCRDIDK